MFNIQQFIILKLYLGCLLCSSIVVSESDCPVECSCLGNKVFCKDLMLVGIPAKLPPWTEGLILKGNRFSNLEFNSLLNLPKLQELDVSSNKLIDNFTLSLSEETQLRSLKLNKNHLTCIPKLSLSYLTHLSLSHNDIVTIDGAVLIKYPELQNLDLTGNKITTIQIGSFFVSNQLKILNLNSNQIDKIESRSFQNLTSLQELRLNKNHITDLKDFLKDLDKLRILEVNRNEIKQIEYTTFFGLISLEKLKLKRNKIDTLKDGAFWPLHNLTELQLDYNLITVISKGVLFGLDHLEILTLSHNKINSIQHASWEVCKELLELDLSHNQLNVIDHTTFSSLRKLKKLILDDNSVTTIDGAFKDLSNLQELQLNLNKISYIVEDVGGVFSSLSELQKLGIAHNQIKSINKNAFNGLSQLVELDLLGNNITGIQENAFTPLSKLTILKMNTSSLFCDCGLQWFATWLQVNRYSGTRVRCGYPHWLNGTIPTQLHHSNFTCDQFPKPRITKEPLTQLKIRGDSLNLTCGATATADAPLKFTWKHNNVEIKDKSLQNDYLNTTEDGTIESYSILSLKNLTDADSGRYQCIVTNSYGTTYSAKARINVYIFPSFSKIPKDLRAPASSTARLECSAEGFPSPQIAWQKDGGNDFPAARERRMHKMPTDDVLFIINVKALDSGVYSCIAQNTVGTITANATLTVLETPSFVKPMENKEVISGDSIVLECMSSGSPKPQLNWRKNGSPLQATERHFFTAENQLLIIVNTIESDAGTYECEMSNSLGSVIGASLVTIKSDSKTTVPIVNEDDILGLIIITVVCCAVGTSIIWVAIIYQTRRRLNTRNTSRQAPVIVPTSDPHVDFHLNVDASSQHSKDSGTGGSANPSDNQLHMYIPAASVRCTINNEDESVNVEGANPLLSYTNHDRHIFTQKD